MSLKNNTLLQGGKYKIIRFINSGGFGCTYEAEHSLSKAHVAIKEFFKEDMCNRDGRTNKVTVGVRSKVETVSKLKKKFLEEATSVFQMKHPGIVRVIDIFEENGTAYYVMDFIDGCSLEDLLKRRRKLPEKEALHYILQVVDALQYVHARNRLHLDIKPGNIMVDKHGRAILIDFGASKHYNENSGKQDSTLLGINTPGYTPVEQAARNFSKFNPATDIYALGATLYKLLTGITPTASILRADEDDENEIFNYLPSTLSASTRKALVAAMQVRSINRPQNLEEFKKMLGENTTNDEKTVYEDFGDTVEAIVVDAGKTSAYEKRESVVSKQKKTVSNRKKEENINDGTEYVSDSNKNIENNNITAGDNAYERKDYPTALHYYKEAFRYNNTLDEIAYKIGEIYYRGHDITEKKQKGAGRYSSMNDLYHREEKAKTWFKIAYDLGIDTSNVLLSKAQTYYQQKNYKRYLKALQECVLKNYRCEKAILLLIEAYEKGIGCKKNGIPSYQLDNLKKQLQQAENNEQAQNDINDKPEQEQKIKLNNCQGILSKNKMKSIINK